MLANLQAQPTQKVVQESLKLALVYLEDGLDSAPA